jgi:hypothetical protein
MAPELSQALLVCVAAYFGLLVPLHLHATARWRARAIKETELTGLESKVMEYFKKNTETLEALGFVVDQTVELRYLMDPHRVVSVYVSHPETKVFGYISALVDTEEGKGALYYAGLAVELESGRELEVINSSGYAFWHHDPKLLRYCLDGEEDLGLLNALTLHAVALHQRDHPDDLTKPREFSLERMCVQEKALLDYQVTRGMLSYNPKDDLYRCTMPGAYRLMLHSSFPFSAMIRAELRKHGMALKRSYLQIQKATQ